MIGRKLRIRLRVEEGGVEQGGMLNSEGLPWMLALLPKLCDLGSSLHLSHLWNGVHNIPVKMLWGLARDVVYMCVESRAL